MIRILALIVAVMLGAGAARADQFDVVLRFNTLALAKADADVQAHYDAVQDAFAGDRVIRVQVWRNSQDVAGTDAQGNPTVTHNFMAGFFVLISLPRLVPALRDNAAVQIVLNRDKCNARQAGCVVRSTVTNAVLQDLRISPVFAGSDLPWGGLN